MEPGMDILVIEDDTDIRDMTGALLECEGYRVACAANGREALQLLRRSGLPRLILLDLMMPVMSGWEFRRRQREDPILAPVPVIVLSAVSDVSRETASMGAIRCLCKPMEFDVLLRTVRQVCPAGCRAQRK